MTTKTITTRGAVGAVGVLGDDNGIVAAGTLRDMRARFGDGRDLVAVCGDEVAEINAEAARDGSAAWDWSNDGYAVLRSGRYGDGA